MTMILPEFTFKKTFFRQYGAIDESLVNQFPCDSLYKRMMSQDSAELNGMITTRISTFARTRHVLGLDVDSDRDLESVCRYLHIHSIPYITVESSPDHYWVFGNCVFSDKRLWNFLDECLGVDEEWVEMCEGYDRLMFRAFPKQSGYPRFPERLFPRDGLAGEWLYQFQAYFNSWYYRNLMNKFYPESEEPRPKDCYHCRRLLNPASSFCPRCGVSVVGGRKAKTLESLRA